MKLIKRLIIFIILVILVIGVAIGVIFGIPGYNTRDRRMAVDRTRW